MGLPEPISSGNRPSPANVVRAQRLGVVADGVPAAEVALPVADPLPTPPVLPDSALYEPAADGGRCCWSGRYSSWCRSYRYSPNRHCRSWSR